MMFQSFWQFAWPHTCIFFLLIVYNFTISASKSSVSYSKHCASVVPEATATTYADFAFPYLQTLTTSFTGAERIFGNSPYSSLNFRTSKNVLATNTHGVYKIDAELIFRLYNDMYFSARNSTYGRSSRRRTRLKFVLHGFWSESTGKGCFVGSASWYSSKGEPLHFEATFKMNYSKNSTYSNSFFTGKLESLSHLNDESYFELISILSFPQIQTNQYEYKLISDESVRGFNVDDIKNSPVLDLQPGEICSMFNLEYISFNLEYASSCSSTSLKNCSPLDGVLEYSPTYLSLYSIECYEFGNKMRFLVQLTNRSYVGRYEMFDPNSTLVGEGMWDEAKNCLVIAACRISTSNSLEDAHVGNCSFRLNIWYPSVWSIKNRYKAVDQIWTNKTAEDAGYFDKIKIRTSDNYMNVPGFKYEYTEIEKVNKLCPKKAVTKGKTYPSAQSYDMRFDISVQNAKYFRWGSAEPIFVGHKSYAHSPVYMSSTRRGGYGEIVESEVEFGNADLDTVPLNVSYKFSFSSMGNVKLGAGHSSLNASLNSYGQLFISAEGVYDAGTGYLCMVGCRDLGSNNSQDCDILLNFQFPGSEGSNGGFIKGGMKSTRKQSDPLFF